MLLEKGVYDEISAIAKTLDDKQRRALYSDIVSAIKNTEEDEFKQAFKSLPCSFDIEEDTCRKITDMVSLGIGKFGIVFVWGLYEFLCSGQTANRLGQYFTTESLADFALSSLDLTPKKILDPMAGHGSFLIAASKRFPSASLIGVDIDNLPLKAANLILGNKAELYREDVFSWALRNVNELGFQFDAIVGNPAYISYQNLEKIGKFRNLKSNYRKYLLQSLTEIAKQKGADSDLDKLLQSWSGYSDMAVYVIVLSWLLLDERGQIVFVTTNHWLERGYGLPIKRFLAKHGTIKAIVTQPYGEWFPSAQIPTNIFIYTKGNASTRQEALGIPYVEVLEKKNGKTVLNIEPKGFWHLIESSKEPIKGKSIKVSFKRWTSKNRLSLKSVDDSNILESIEIPDYISTQKLASFKASGWHVHQGLRTGCNEVFYVGKLSKENKYVAILTRSGKKTIKEIDVPSDLAFPVIQKATSSDPLSLGLNNVDTYLLNFNTTLLPEDLKQIHSQYPSDWKRQWAVEKYKEMPHQLAEYIRECQSIPYEGKGLKRAPASELSAVRTNVHSPSTRAKGIPSPPRFWYQVKLQPRHFGRIIIPRVSGGLLRSYLIDEKNQILTDANFVTLVPKAEKISAKRLWAWLNSNTFRLMSEINGIIMGGRALKLETTIVKKLPIPLQLLNNKSVDLDRTASTLENQFAEQELLRKGEEIDSLVFNRHIAEQVKKDLEDHLKLRKGVAPQA